MNKTNKRVVTRLLLSFSLLAVTLLSPGAYAQVDLGTAQSFGVLGASAVTNTGNSVIDGNLGIWPNTASSITGFPPGTYTGTLHAADGVAQQAQSDLTTAYNAAAGLAFDVDLTGQDLGGMILTPGVYFFSSSAQLTGTLVLNALGDPDAEFVFQIGSTLTTAPNSTVAVLNGGSMPGCNVFWQVGSSATIDTNTNFAGHILALTSISLNTGADIMYGSALAQNGAVTMQDNTIVSCIPEPATISLLLLGAGMVSRKVRTSVGRRL